jgi:hypothetical protein
MRAENENNAQACKTSTEPNFRRMQCGIDKRRQTDARTQCSLTDPSNLSTTHTNTHPSHPKHILYSTHAITFQHTHRTLSLNFGRQIGVHTSPLRIDDDDVTKLMSSSKSDGKSALSLGRTRLTRCVPARRIAYLRPVFVCACVCGGREEERN